MSVPAQLTLDQAFEMARQSFASGDLASADKLCRAILKVSPNHPSTLRLLALVATRVNRPDIAIQCLFRCTALQPQDDDLRLELGNALLAAGRTKEAVAAYRFATQLNPDNHSAHSNLGIALHEDDDLPQAIQHFRKAVSLNPDSATAQNNLGHALKTQGELTEAIATLTRAISLDGTNIEPYINLAGALENAGMADRAFEVYIQATSRIRSSPKLYSAMSLTSLYLPTVTSQQTFAIHREWNERFAKPLAVNIPSHQNDTSPNRRLKIGYVSPDLRNHPVSSFFEYLVACHDATAYEVYCYADLLRRPDPVTARLRAHSHQWRNITGMGDAQLAELIRKDQIDILVDLAGHTAGNRLLVFAQKPAPIQFTYLGYPASTGLQAIDYRITDSLADPHGVTEPFHSEVLVRLPKTFLCYRPPEHAPPVGSLPAIKNGYISFGSFNRLAKINRPLIELWVNVLKEVINSRLVLKTNGLGDLEVRRRLLDYFIAGGISPDRIEFRSRAASPKDHLDSYNAIDIALDSFPYHGTTTTCEALWMGVPVISLAGQTHASRVGLSILTNTGLENLVANSEREYVDIAQKLAGNLSELSGLRHLLRERMQASPLMAAISFARNVEAQYRAAWKRFCEGAMPAAASRSTS